LGEALKCPIRAATEFSSRKTGEIAAGALSVRPAAIKQDWSDENAATYSCKSRNETDARARERGCNRPRWVRRRFRKILPEERNAN
jgi:hypothetical protein